MSMERMTPEALVEQWLAEQRAGMVGGEGAEAETILAVTSERVYSVPIYDWAWEGDAEVVEAELLRPELGPGET